MRSCGLMAGWIHPSVCKQLVLAVVPQEHCSGMGILLLFIASIHIKCFNSFYLWCSASITNPCQKKNTLPQSSVNSQPFETSIFFVTYLCTTKTPKYSLLIFSLTLKNMENLMEWNFFGKKKNTNQKMEWILAHFNKNFKWCISLKNTIFILWLLSFFLGLHKVSRFSAVAMHLIRRAFTG